MLKPLHEQIQHDLSEEGVTNEALLYNAKRAASVYATDKCTVADKGPV